VDRMRLFLEDLAGVIETNVADLHNEVEFEQESMVTLLIISLVNRHFDMTLDVEELRQCRNVGDLCRAVTGKRRAA
jgi:acyl carrier protein